LIGLVRESRVGKHVDANHKRVGAHDRRAKHDHLAFSEEAEDKANDGQTDQENDTTLGGSDDPARFPAQDPESQGVKGQSAQDGDTETGATDKNETTEDTDAD